MSHKWEWFFPHPYTWKMFVPTGTTLCESDKLADVHRSRAAAKTPARFVHFISIVFVSIVPCRRRRLARRCSLNAVSMDAAGINSAEERHVSTHWIRNFIMFCFLRRALFFPAVRPPPPPPSFGGGCGYGDALDSIIGCARLARSSGRWI